MLPQHPGTGTPTRTRTPTCTRTPASHLGEGLGQILPQAGAQGPRGVSWPEAAPPAAVPALAPCGAKSQELAAVPCAGGRAAPVSPICSLASPALRLLDVRLLGIIFRKLTRICRAILK